MTIIEVIKGDTRRSQGWGLSFKAWGLGWVSRFQVWVGG